MSGTEVRADKHAWQLGYEHGYAKLSARPSYVPIIYRNDYLNGYRIGKAKRDDLDY